MLRQPRREDVGAGGEGGGITGRTAAPPGWHRACLVARRFDQHAHRCPWRRELGNKSGPRLRGPRAHLRPVGSESRGRRHHSRGAAEPSAPARRPAAHAADHHRFAGCGLAGGRAGGAGRPLRRPAPPAGGSAAAAADGRDGAGRHPRPGVDRTRHAPRAGGRDVAAGAPRWTDGAGWPGAGFRSGPRPAQHPGPGGSRRGQSRIGVRRSDRRQPAGPDHLRRRGDGDRLRPPRRGRAGRRPVRGAGAGRERPGHDAGPRLRGDHLAGAGTGRPARDVSGTRGAGRPGAGLQQRPFTGLAGRLSAGAGNDGRAAAGRAPVHRGRGVDQHGGSGSAGPGTRRGHPAVRGAGAFPGQRAIGARGPAGVADLGSRHQPPAGGPVTGGCVRSGRDR
jgi:hypothetical protein